MCTCRGFPRVGCRCGRYQKDTCYSARQKTNGIGSSSVRALGEYEVGTAIGYSWAVIEQGYRARKSVLARRNSNKCSATITLFHRFVAIEREKSRTK